LTRAKEIKKLCARYPPGTRTALPFFHFVTTASLSAQVPIDNFLLFILQFNLGNVRGGGTDSSVFLQLFGPNGDSGRQKLDAKRSAFERAKEDQFGLELVDLGDLTKLIIGHDNSGLGSGWFLDSVIIKNESNGKGGRHVFNLYLFFF